jgi:hypothetical protein
MTLNLCSEICIEARDQGPYMYVLLEEEVLLSFFGVVPLFPYGRSVEVAT